MRILVFGAGAIGSLFGGLLSQRYNVTLLGRKEHVKAIRENGLRISGIAELITYPKVVNKVEEVEDLDLVLLTVKSYDVARAAKELSKISRLPPILLLQNGLNVVEEMKKRTNQGLLRGVTAHGAMVKEPGAIYHAGVGITVIGELNGRVGERIKTINQIFNSVGIKTKISRSIVKEVWKKTIINACINPITALLEMENGYLVKIPEIEALAREVCEECEKVALAKGIVVKNMFKEVKRIAKLTAENKSSMLQDVERGKPTEIDWINGKIAELGKHYGISTPLNTALTQLVKAKASHRRI